MFFKSYGSVGFYRMLAYASLYNSALAGRFLLCSFMRSDRHLIQSDRIGILLKLQEKRVIYAHIALSIQFVVQRPYNNICTSIICMAPSLCTLTLMLVQSKFQKEIPRPILSVCAVNLWFPSKKGIRKRCFFSRTFPLCYFVICYPIIGMNRFLGCFFFGLQIQFGSCQHPYEVHWFLGNVMLSSSGTSPGV